MGLDDIVGGFIGMLDVHLGSDRAGLEQGVGKRALRRGSWRDER